MDAFMVIFRLIHIFSGIIWVGSAIFLVLVMRPALAADPADGRRFMLRLYNASVYGPLIGIVSVLTTISGLALYDRVSNHFDSDWMSSTPGIVLGIGALAGLLAFGHGAGTLGRYSGQFGKIAKEVGAGEPSEAQVNRLVELDAKIWTNARISLIMMIISVVGMASARYM